ncbi:hypothetical protein ABIQ69_11415 [Agromyces sp. G08B096]|uniref:Uncharacterized protein n=1 Tax=Agromyces sp. G08B096 TaxID=3156399 RepID=A0AAU7W665_9MICO
MSSEDLRRELVDLIREHDLASDENTSPRDYRAALADAILPLVEEAVNDQAARAVSFSTAISYSGALALIQELAGLDAIERRVAQAVSAERLRCLRIAEGHEHDESGARAARQHDLGDWVTGWDEAASSIAFAIRTPEPTKEAEEFQRGADPCTCAWECTCGTYSGGES